MAEDGLGWPSGRPWEAPRGPQEAPERPKMSSGTRTQHCASTPPSVLRARVCPPANIATAVLKTLGQGPTTPVSTVFARENLTRPRPTAVRIRSSWLLFTSGRNLWCPEMRGFHLLRACYYWSLRLLLILLTAYYNLQATSSLCSRR